jgi:hypothetical protein
MDDANAIEPFGFFTLDALRAGWYLVWRQLVRIAIGAVVVGGASAALAALGLAVVAIVVLGLGAGAVTIWAAIMIPRLTIQWAEQWYGATLTGQVRIWWGIAWRVFVASLVAAVVCTPPNFVALSLTTAFPNSALGMLGGLLSVLLGIANFGVSLLATGWAMSKVAVEQIAAGEALAPALPPVAGAVAVAPPPVQPEPMPEPLVAAPLPVDPEPVARSLADDTPAPAPVLAAAPALASAARPAAVATAPRPAPAGDRRQCPKCSLYETERGSIIGWYCKICGWREGKSR